jgi:hypothetical protein
MAYEASQGIGFAFSGTKFTATQIAVSKKTPEIDVTSLEAPNGSYRSYRLGSIRDGDELKVDFIGLTLPQMTATGSITWTIDGTGSNAAFTTGLPTAALVTSADVTAQVGELIKGSMSLRLTQN